MIKILLNSGTPSKIDAIIFCWLITAELEKDELLLKARIWPDLLPGWKNNSLVSGQLLKIVRQKANLF